MPKANGCLCKWVPDRTARFMLAWQAAGTSPIFTLTKGGPAPDQVTVKPEGGDLAIQVGGKPAFSYRMDREKLPRPDIKPEYKRAGYLYPIVSPSGRPVADDYPVQHVHHHGIWSPWTKTKFQGRTPDFWNMGQKTGTVEFVGLERSWSGPGRGWFCRAPSHGRPLRPPRRWSPCTKPGKSPRTTSARQNNRCSSLNWC
jgi:hypothetical protein